MQKIEPFTCGNFYHVYNRGINGCDIFKDNDNYGYFLKLYDEYISPVVDTFAWVLMPIQNPDRVPNPVRVGTSPPVRVENH